MHIKKSYTYKRSQLEIIYVKDLLIFPSLFGLINGIMFWMRPKNLMNGLFDDFYLKKLVKW